LYLPVALEKTSIEECALKIKAQYENPSEAFRSLGWTELIYFALDKVTLSGDDSALDPPSKRRKMH
jgi:hypothetical protein